MAPPRRRRLIPRRQRDDEGEEEGSVLGDLEDDSLSEGSIVSDGEAEASEGSLDDERDLATENESPQRKKTELQPPSVPETKPDPTETTAPLSLAPSADTVAMMNGVSLEDAASVGEELHFDEAVAEESTATAETAKSSVNIPRAPRNETHAQKARREHQEYIRQRDSDPAFVPTRGGFFLHDDRQSAIPPFVHQAAVRGRGRGRGYNGVYGPHGVAPPGPSDFQWAHDLHDKHESTKSPPSSVNPPTSANAAENKTHPIKPASTAPNRTFSFSTVLGNVTVNVSLPDTLEKKSLSNVVKKHHTLLPQHRPPLRRDKPVRISLPDDHPRYIFPSTERSFIFIPRALRPNQQPYMRGRGRGSFQGSRRTSVYAASTYTPSVAMSRKSSFGGVRDNLRSPMGSNSSRANLSGLDNLRPVVRLPGPSMVPGPMPMPQPVPPAAMPAMNGAFANGYSPAPLPLYQPRPQKTVSVADIESPASMAVKGPQQQQEQPFHQQMPTYVGDSGPSSAPQGTPLSHIPEGAIFAQPFQPFPQMQAPVFYPMPYSNGQAFYPPAMADGMQFASPMTGMPVAPAYRGGAPHPQGSVNGQVPAMAQANTMAHMSNGMVFYYDPMQVQTEGQPGQGQFGMPATAPMNPQAQYYYPVAPFYPAQSA